MIFAVFDANVCHFSSHLYIWHEAVVLGCLCSIFCWICIYFSLLSYCI